MATNERTYHVYGPPGCGKTTTLAGYARSAIERRGNESVCIASLTRAASSEIAGRGLDAPKNQIGTLHSLCYHALGQPKIGEVHISEWNEAHPRLKIDNEYSKEIDDGLGDSMSGRGEGPNATFELMNTLRARMIPKEAWPLKAQRFHDHWQDWLDNNEYMDFTGLIENALKYTTSAPGLPSVLIGDEAQDWSKLEVSLFRDRWGEKAETIILAGDPDQSIYAWRGADPGIFMNHPIPDANRRVLSQSYRLPAGPHAQALRMIRRIKTREDIEYLPTPTQGAVRRATATYRQPEALVDMIRADIEQSRTVMVLATCGYMLEPLIKEMRRVGIPFHNPYRRKNGKWNPLARKKRQTTAADRVLAFLRPDSTVWGDELRDWTGKDLKAWMSVLQSEGVLARGVKTFIESKDFTAPPNMSEFASLFDPVDHADSARECDLDWYLDHVLSKKRAVMEFPIRIAKRYGGAKLLDDPLVTIGTVHSVKGGEADSVYIFPDLSPRAVDTFAVARESEQRDAVIRVFYVGYTRTRDTLTLCNPASGMSFF